MNELVAVERQLQVLAPRFELVLDNRVPVKRLLQTVIVSCERTPKLLQCNRQSLFNSAMSAAVLGLEVDGMTGQAYIIPFKGTAQLVIGYKGYNTMGARSGLSISGEVVREGDNFDYDLGEGWVRHKPVNSKNRITHAWAKAAHGQRPALIKVLTIDEIMVIKQRSPGARKEESPWNDPAIGFPAMAEKSAKRRLARVLPLNVMQYAARMEEAFDEQGMHSWISPEKGVVIEGQLESNPTPTYEQLTGATVSPVDTAPPAQAPQPTGGADVYAEHHTALTAAAKKGMPELFDAWQALPREVAIALKPDLDSHYKPMAEQVEQQ